MAEVPTGTISKREQKRQAKLAKEQAAKVSAESGSIDIPAGEVLPVLEEDTNVTNDVDQEQKPSPFIEPVQKRYWQDDVAGYA